MAATPSKTFPLIAISLKLVDVKDLGEGKSLPKEILVMGNMRLRSTEPEGDLLGLKVKVDAQGEDSILFLYRKGKTERFYVNATAVPSGMHALQVMELLKLHNPARPAKVSIMVHVTANKNALTVVFQVAPIIKGRVGASSHLKLFCSRA